MIPFQARMREIQGAICVSSLLQILIGYSGLISTWGLFFQAEMFLIQTFLGQKTFWFYGRILGKEIFKEVSN